MRLSQAALPVDEQGVEMGLAGHFRHGDGHGIGHAVRIANDEVLERERGRRAVGFGHHGACGHVMSSVVGDRDRDFGAFPFVRGGLPVGSFLFACVRARLRPLPGRCRR